jgi:hypothetical protein
VDKGSAELLGKMGREGRGCARFAFCGWAEERGDVGLGKAVVGWGDGMSLFTCDPDVDGGETVAIQMTIASADDAGHPRAVHAG